MEEHKSAHEQTGCLTMSEAERLYENRKRKKEWGIANNGRGEKRNTVGYAKWESEKESACDLSQMSTLLLFPPELCQRPNANASVTDVVSCRPCRCWVTLWVGAHPSSVGDDEAINPTDCKELMAAEHTRSHRDICVGVSVGVHMHANLFVCLHLFVCPYKRGLSKSLWGWLMIICTHVLSLTAFLFLFLPTICQITYKTPDRIRISYFMCMCACISP